MSGTPHPMSGAPRPEPTHVALFASSFHPHPGGVEELVRQLAHAEVDAGLSPTVITMRWPKDLPARERFESLPVERYVFRSPELPARRLAAALGLGPVTLAQLVASLRAQRCQLVHIQCVSPAAWYALQATRILHLPLVVTMQGELTMDATGLYQRSGWARRVLRAVLTHADAITACSAHTLAEAEDWYGRPFGDRAEVIHNGVSPEDFALVPAHREADPYVFAIGRHVPQKGFDVLLEAYARLCADPSFRHRLLLAGDGTERTALEQLARDLAVADRVDFLGVTDRDRTAALFRGADLFVLPSRLEPFGIVVLEALAAGAAVVACDVGGVREFLPVGPKACLVAPDDPEAMAQGIVAVAATPARSVEDDQADARAEVVAEHGWDRIAARYDAAYRRAVEHHARRPSESPVR